MLELRPSCERCGRDLPPESTEARICSYECTFCSECVEGALNNVCPNCGGGFVPRPIRPGGRGEEAVTTERINPDSLPPSSGQSQIVKTDAKTTIYLSGQLPLDASGSLVGAGDFRAQAQQVLKNVRVALAAASPDGATAVKLTVYIAKLDVADHGPVLKEVLGDLSQLGHPAATLLSVEGLARPGCMIEIDAVAVVR